MPGTHHLFSRDWGASSELSADITRDHVTLHVHEPSDDPQILGRTLVSVQMPRWDADRFLTEVLRSAGSHDG
ncbi:MAG: hypothetical protein QOF58_5645 [Pseudonocardiales bacterium]|jgi:hypothetical protein|nr:hypothetical protein [Pseudonocardiales bacterium]